MAESVGVLDHIAIAARSIEQAREFYERVMGGRFMYERERPDKGYRLCKIESLPRCDRIDRTPRLRLLPA